MDNSEPVTKKDLGELEARLETRIVDRLTELIRGVESTLLTTFRDASRAITLENAL
jgi:hypothetical protein